MQRKISGCFEKESFLFFTRNSLNPHICWMSAFLIHCEIQSIYRTGSTARKTTRCERQVSCRPAITVWYEKQWDICMNVYAAGALECFCRRLIVSIISASPKTFREVAVLERISHLAKQISSIPFHTCASITEFRYAKTGNILPMTEEHHFLRMILWTDESLFTRDAILNLHNWHHYG